MLAFTLMERSSMFRPISPNLVVRFQANIILITHLFDDYRR
jgi:hypothetical protein